MKKKMSLSTTITPTVLLLNSISYSWNRNSDSGPILSDINLSVQQGEIFGLLGASGSGKTTLVRLILGRLFPSSGIISLLGNRVDGPRNPPTPSEIGYMPQDLVLYQQFTPVEMLRYFGQLYKLSREEIEKRIDFVLRLLSLKQFLQAESKLTQEYTMQIQQLSGGQKRRISLAIALLHRPRFLILDEPTVGCDPLLRETIWMHLKQLTSSTTSPVTVFLTTHYIEEARDAQSIGFLRNGRLLVQDSPQNLLDRFATTSMEKVFLQLCRKANAEQTNGADRLSPTANGEFPFEGVKVENMLEGVNLKNKLELLPPLDIRTSSQILSPLSLLTANKKISPNGITVAAKDNESSSLPIKKRKQSSVVASKFSSCFTFNHHFNHVLRPPEDPYTYTGTPAREHFICPAHLLTLMGKNFRQLRRNSSLLIFFILLPAIEIALIMLCIGREIENIPIAVFNGEPTPDLSLIFLQSIPDGAFLQQNYATPEAALEAVAESRAHALLQFSPNFSNALRARFFSFAFDDAEVLSSISNSTADNSLLSASGSSNGTSIYDESSVFVRLDMSNQLIGLQVQRQLLKAFLNFAQRLASNMGLSNQTFKPPLNFGEPVYGIQGGASAVVETFIAPGALIMIAFFATTIVTCHLLIHEVRQALIERALIAGASSAEFLFSHIVIQSSILMIQLTLMLLTAFKLFSMPYLGSLLLSFSLVTLQGLCGLMYGLMLSATCPDEIYATTLAIGTFFPSVIIGGIFWPVQSMPMALQYLSHALPSTVSIDALRSILLRNWGLRSANVAGAFAVTAFWLAVFLMCALRNFKRRI